MCEVPVLKTLALIEKDFMEAVDVLLIYRGSFKRYSQERKCL